MFGYGHKAKRPETKSATLAMPSIHGRSRGFSAVRDLVGHGVGYDVHEDPSVPCFGKKGTGETLKEGMVLAVEPMVTAGEYLLT